MLCKGHKVKFFHAVDVSKKTAVYVMPSQVPNRGPALLQSHGWLDGTLQADYKPDSLDLKDPQTWPSVDPCESIQFVQIPRKGRPVKCMLETQRVPLILDGNIPYQDPLLSLVFVRWGGAQSGWMDDPDKVANDGDWGQYGSPTSDQYIASVIELGVMAHPSLADDRQNFRNFEIFTILVASAQDARDIRPLAPQMYGILKGRKKNCWWMLWPAEWQDFDDPDYACYVERQALFDAMRACEAEGIRSGFPHPADQFELITSKQWMATLCLNPGVHLPAGTFVTKEAVVADVERATTDALAAIHRIRSLCPFPAGQDEPPAPSCINKNGVVKGVVKLGWSWENRFVSHFNGKAELQEKLNEILTIPGLLASQCLVQEWVDFDFEMRLYFLAASCDATSPRLLPERIECNQWGPHNGQSTLGHCHASFKKLSEDKVLEVWGQDHEAWESAKQQAIDVSQLLLAWLGAANAQTVPMIRLDFMLKRLGSGKSRVIFGEFCEMGACCLGWKEGPPTIWRAALDNALK